MGNKFSYIIISVAVCLSVIGLWFYSSKKENIGPDSFKTPDFIELESKAKEVLVQMSKEDERLEYLSASPKFSFLYPKSFNITRFREMGGEVVLLQSSETQLGLQVFISDYSSSAPVTINKLKSDLPDMQMIKPELISVGGASGVAFESEGMYEVWFAKNNKLYQITSYSHQKSLTDKIVSSWQW